MSPEQARGLDNIDLRSDVWSFSVVLYEAITGDVPFESANYNALLRMIVEAEPKSLREQAAADDELSQIVQRGLSKEPAQRFASMGLMGKALAVWLSGQGITEDACGVSLEARWLSRSSDPAALGRVSLSSLPDFWPEPPSGVRVVTSRFGRAPTVPVVAHAGTPHALAQTLAARSKASRPLLLGAAGAALLLGLRLGYREVVHSRPSRERVAASLPPRPQAAAPRPELVALAAAALAPSSYGPAPKASAPPVIGSKPATTVAPAKPPPSAPVATTLPPSAPVATTPPAPVGAPPKFDLLTPY